MRTAVALLPAVALGVYVRHPGMAWLSFVALVPWIVLYTDGRRPRTSSVYYAVGALSTWIALYPGCYGFGWFAPLVMGISCVVCHTVAGPSQPGESPANASFVSDPTGPIRGPNGRRCGAEGKETVSRLYRGILETKDMVMQTKSGIRQ